MARDRKDRSVSWFMAHHGGSLLRLAPVSPFVSWRAGPTVLAFPKQVPDGLLDVTFADKAAPDPFLIEIEAYPEQDTLAQIRKDVAMVLLTRGVVPDVLLLVLRPKGNLTIQPEQIVHSARGLTALHLRVHVVNLWTVPAEELLAAGDVGLIPWVPLAHYDGSPEALLRQCRERIDQQATPEERDSMIAITRVMAEARYNDAQLLSVLGEPLMSIEKVLLQSPTVQRLLDSKAEELAAKKVVKKERQLAEQGRQLAEKERQLAEQGRQLAEQGHQLAEKERQLAEAERRAAEETARATVRKAVLRVLQQRFGLVPEEVVGQLQAIQEQQKLDDLLGVTVGCLSLEAFRQALSQP